MPADFERIAIVNRGEPALRLIRAVRDLGGDYGGRLRSIALFTEPDRAALFAREADEAHDLGPVTLPDGSEGRTRSAYLDHERLARALRETKADAVWVGWGFVAEQADFADLCRRLDIVFIGPDADVMRSLGDKIGSKQLAEKAGAGVAPWSGGPVESIADAHRQAERLGFPLMVKATAGGGGRGIRRVHSLAELDEAFESARSEALQGFGDSTVFMERLLEGARHIEVQIIGDRAGTVWALGVRDCTVQRRNQKVMEESPSPALRPEEERQVCDAAVRLAQLAGYRNAGTVEFLFDEKTRRFSFMEVNARLQVEHPVTEAVTGLDLVKLQIRVARGELLEGDPPAPRGHAIEVRVNAEDPERAFAPAPGTIELFRPPGGAGIRIDSGFLEGDRIASEFDSMLAKIIAHGRDRAEALARLRRALLETRLAVRGGATNRGFLLALLDRPEVKSGQLDVSWLDRLAAEGSHLPREHADVALLQAGIEACETQLGAERATFSASAARGRPHANSGVGCSIELRYRGGAYALDVYRTGPHSYRIRVDGKELPLRVEPLGRLDSRLSVGGQSFRVTSLRSDSDQLVEVEGVPHRISLDTAGVIRSPAPAVVLSVAVEIGTEVARGDRLAVLEAMKTEQPVLAPFAGRVREVHAVRNTQVDAGTPLLVLEPLSREEPSEAAERVSIEALAGTHAAGDARARCVRALEELRHMILGFDIETARVRELAQQWRSSCEELEPEDREVLRAEQTILTAFSDLSGLYRRRGAAGRAAADRRESPSELLLRYLRSPEGAGEGLPASFLDRLSRALSHYGVDSLTPSSELQDSLLRIWKAHQRAGDQAGVVLEILRRWFDQVDALSSFVDEDLHTLLDRVVAATRGNQRAISDLAREVRYRFFDRPFFERAREAGYSAATADLEALLAQPHGPERGAQVEALVECSYPLASLLVRRLGQGSGDQRQRLLEVLARRYYRTRDLQDFRTGEHDGRAFARAEYDHEQRRIQLLATHSVWNDLDDVLAALGSEPEAASSDREIVVDLYVERDTPHDDPDATEAELRQRLAAADLPGNVTRVVTAIVAASSDRSLGGMQHFTHRRVGDGDGDGFEEERIYRGLHTMMGVRLEIWRLANFEIERLPSPDDVYVLRGVARGNPRDERLFVFAEVRDLTPLRDDRGRVLRFPHLEMMLLEALATIRLFQSRRTTRTRLHWNRVLLYIWPPLDLSMEEINDLAHRLAPATADLGLEKVVVRARVPDPRTGALADRVIQAGTPAGRGMVLTITEPAEQLISEFSEYAQKVVRMRQRGLTYPYEVISLLTPTREQATAFPPGEFDEYDLDDASGRLVAIERRPGENRSNVIVGVIRNFTNKHPEGMERVIILGDPIGAMGSLDEGECRRINCALDLAKERKLPVEWFAVSAGARISMETGTETMDWCAAVIRRLVEFTQAGGEVNVVVNGVNVGAQSYWNAEATMLMHTSGILIMMPGTSMVLTGKRALDFSGGVSAEDNEGIGGYDRVMGPNGQAQYWAADVAEACQLLLRYYDHAYVAPGEHFARRAPSEDPRDRDICSYPHGRGDGHAFDFVGEIFSNDSNPGRRKPFDILKVMAASIDQDHEPLARWEDLRDGETAVVWDAHLGGIPVCMIGIESRPLARADFAPADGPEQWTAATLFPLSSKKVARAINAASGNRPVVILANLAGFDGSPESLRRLQLEYGAEIGRAVVNFRGPIVMCVVSRYHGGAYVVFSAVLNENLRVAAIEGSHASVIGGAPAAAVVFAAEVDRRARDEPRLAALDQEIARAGDSQRASLRSRWHELYETVHSDKLGEVAEEFDSVHSVQRARSVGSLHDILEASRLRPYLIDAVEAGISKELERLRCDQAPG